MTVLPRCIHCHGVIWPWQSRGLRVTTGGTIWWHGKHSKVGIL